MDFILVLFIVLVGGGWLVGKMLGNMLFPKSNDYNESSKESPTIINNYTTEQHLHITEESLKKLVSNKSTSKVN